MKILHISQKSIDLLSTGQIITKACSIVKELAENSVDAGTTCIEVKVENFGLDLIQVADNGHGISADDAQSMGLAHWTSKIVDCSDLESLTTYGFRGEAFHAICCAANVSVSTRQKEESIGRLITYDSKGNVIDIKQFPAKQGTTVTAKNLFHNFPVRRQQCLAMNRKKDDLKQIERLLMSLGVIHPELRITLSHNKTQIWCKNRCGDITGSISQVLGFTVAKYLNCLKSEEENSKVYVEMYMPDPLFIHVSELTCGNTDKLFVFVNERPVRISKIEKLIRTSFDTRGLHKYPVGVVIIKVPPSDVDVNLEPDKSRVFLKNEEEVLTTMKSLLDAWYMKRVAVAQAPEIIDINSVARVARSASEAYAAESADAVSLPKTTAGITKNGVADGGNMKGGWLSLKPSGSASQARLSGKSSQFCMPDSRNMLKEKDIRRFQINNLDEVNHRGPKRAKTSAEKDTGIRFLNIPDVPKKFPPWASKLGGDDKSSVQSDSVYPPSAQAPKFDFRDFEDNAMQVGPEAPCVDVFERLLGPTRSIDESRDSPSALEPHISSSEQARASHFLADVSVDASNQIQTGSDVLSGGQTERITFEPFPAMNLYVHSDTTFAASVDQAPFRKPPFVSNPSIGVIAESIVSRACNEPLSEIDSNGNLSDQVKVIPVSRLDDNTDAMQNVLEAGISAESDPVASTLNSSDWSRGTALAPTVQPYGIFISGPKNGGRAEGRIGGCKPNKVGSSPSNKAKKLKTSFETVNNKVVKRPKSAYEYFCKESRPAIVEEYPGADFALVGRLLGDKWKMLDPEEKKKYNSLADDDKARYRKEYRIASQDVRYTDKKHLQLEIQVNQSSGGPKRLLREEHRPEEYIVDDVHMPVKLIDITEKLGRIDLSERSPDGIVGSLVGFDGWAVVVGNSVGIINPTRISEVKIFHELLSRERINSQKIAKPLTIGRRDTSEAVWQGVENLEIQETGHSSTVIDARLIANGIKGEIFRDSYDHYLLIKEMPADVPFFGKSDIEEALTKCGISCDVATSRPVKIKHYLQGEALRACHLVTGTLQRIEVQDILNYMVSELAEVDTCLHDRPLFHPLVNILEESR